MKSKERGSSGVNRQKGGGSSLQQRAVKSKKRNLEVEKSKEHQEPPTKRQNTAVSRGTIIEARSREVNTSGQRVSKEVSSDSKSSGYSDSTE